MTPEELLRPRYKVVADYFHNPYQIGDIITLPENNRSVHLTTIQYTDEFGENVKQQNHYAPKIIEKYPHLFEKLEWWEERKPEDLPKFIKAKNDGDVQELIAVTECGFKVKWGNKKKYRIGVFNRFIPATEAEYTQYVKTLNQQP